MLPCPRCLASRRAWAPSRAVGQARGAAAASPGTDHPLFPRRLGTEPPASSAAHSPRPVGHWEPPGLAQKAKCWPVGTEAKPGDPSTPAQHHQPGYCPTPSGSHSQRLTARHSHGDALRAEWSQARGHQPRRQPLRHECFWAGGRPRPALCFPAGLRPGRTSLSGAGGPLCCPNPAAFGRKHRVRAPERAGPWERPAGRRQCNQAPGFRSPSSCRQEGGKPAGALRLPGRPHEWAEDPGHLRAQPDGPRARAPLPPGALPPPPAHPHPPVPGTRCQVSPIPTPWAHLSSLPLTPAMARGPSTAPRAQGLLSSPLGSWLPGALWSLRTSTFQGLEGFAGHMGWAGSLRTSARAGGAGAQPSGSLLAWMAARCCRSVGLLTCKGREGRPESFGEGPGGLTLTDGRSAARAAWAHRGARALLKLSPRPRRLQSPVGRLSLGSQDHSGLGREGLPAQGPARWVPAITTGSSL